MMRPRPVVGAALVLFAGASLARAEVVLNTAASQQYGGGKVACSAVNVGPQTLDIRLELTKISDGTITEEDCTGDNAVDPEERCVTDPVDADIYFCRVHVDLPGGSNPPSPLLAMVRQWVRATIVSFSSEPQGFTALPAD